VTGERYFQVTDPCGVVYQLVTWLGPSPDVEPRPQPSASRIRSIAAVSAGSTPLFAEAARSATPSATPRYASTSSGALASSVSLADPSAARVSASPSSRESVSPNPPRPWTPASSRIKSLPPDACCSPRYLAIALTSPNVSVKSGSLRATSSPEPIRPFCIVCHSSSVKSAFVAIGSSFQSEQSRVILAAGRCRRAQEESERRFRTRLCAGRRHRLAVAWPAAAEHRHHGPDDARRRRDRRRRLGLRRRALGGAHALPRTVLRARP